MAGSVNKVILVGNLGGDPEVRPTPGGSVANFNIATSEAWTNKDGNREERTEWHRIVAWGRLAELCGEFLAKGRKVYVEGRLQTRSYEKDGVTRYVTEIKAQDIQFLDPIGNARVDGISEAPRAAEPPPARAPEPPAPARSAPAPSRSAPAPAPSRGAPSRGAPSRGRTPEPNYGPPDYASGGDDDDIPF